MKPPLSTSLEHGAWARIEAEAKVTRLLDIIHSITRGTRVPLGQFRLSAAGFRCMFQRIVLLPREQLDLEVARLSVRSQVLKENAEKLVEARRL